MLLYGPTLITIREVVTIASLPYCGNEILTKLKPPATTPSFDSTTPKLLNMSSLTLVKIHILSHLPERPCMDTNHLVWQVVTTRRALETCEEQHFTFLWYLIYKFIICTSNRHLIKDTQPMALTLCAGVKSTLSTVILDNCYRLIYTVVTQNPFSLVLSSSWLI